MSERAITFGAMGGLVGVLSEPERSTRRDVPAVLLWNVGINHHVGPSRIWVDLARRLADSGDRTARWIGADAVRELTDPRQIARLKR